jgi:hypothetical protein
MLVLFAAAFGLGYWSGHQVGFDEGLTHASKGAYLDRQDHRGELFDTGE